MSNDVGGYPRPAAAAGLSTPRLSATGLPGLSAARLPGLPAARATSRVIPRPAIRPRIRPRHPAMPRRVMPPSATGQLKPGVIPLRPLSLSDIFNGAVAYIRANPKATLGLTTVVVVAAQLLALILSVGPLAVTGELRPSLAGEEVSTGALLGSSASSIAGAVATWLSSLLLSGMLTVVIGRAVFGTTITVGEAWRRLRPRIWALIGFTVLEVIAAIVLVTIVVLIIVGVAVAAGGVAAGVVGVPLASDRRADSLSGRCSASRRRSSCWSDSASPPRSRDRSNWCAAISGACSASGCSAESSPVVAGAVAVPFSFGGQMLLSSASSTVAAFVALVLLSIGGAIGQIITAPFSAGVVVLLYTDRRIRAEAFDLVLQTGAAWGPGAPADSTDHLWLTRQA